MTKPAHTTLGERHPEYRPESEGPAGRQASGQTEADEIVRLKDLARALLAELGMLGVAQDLEAEGRIDFFVEVARFEVSLIERAILKAGGNQRHAARLLGMSPSTLHGKLRRYGISAEGPHEHPGDVPTVPPEETNESWAS